MRNEQVGKIGVDSPGSLFVGVGQRTASDLATEADMIEFGLQGLQACLDIAQALAPGQLRESHTEELIQSKRKAGYIWQRARMRAILPVCIQNEGSTTVVTLVPTSAAA
jgi:hypothetical protein